MKGMNTNLVFECNHVTVNCGQSLPLLRNLVTKNWYPHIVSGPLYEGPM